MASDNTKNCLKMTEIVRRKIAESRINKGIAIDYLKWSEGLEIPHNPEVAG